MHPAGLNCALPQAEESILRQRDRFSHYIVPKLAACADMIGELRNQKRLSDFRRACENVRAHVQQTVDDGRSAGVGGLVQFSHGNRVQMKRIACDADIFVDFFVRSGYTVFANFLR